MKNQFKTIHQSNIFFGHNHPFLLTLIGYLFVREFNVSGVYLGVLITVTVIYWLVTIYTAATTDHINVIEKLEYLEKEVAKSKR